VSFPPLRERRGDICKLINHFIGKYNQEMNKKIERLSPDTEQVLMRYDWPGNVRQLENCIERAVVLAQGPQIELAHIPPEIVKQSDGNTQSVEQGLQVGMTVAEAERQLIYKTL